MLNPGQAEPGGLGNLLAQHRTPQGSNAGINPLTPSLQEMPNDQFIRQAEQFMRSSGVGPLAALADLSRRITSEKNAQVQRGLQEGAMLAQQPRTLRDQLGQEALALGIGSQPYEFAGGGLVAFADGGMTDEDIEALPDDAMGFGVGPEFGFTDPADLTMDELRVERSNALNVTAYPPDGQELARQGRLIGIVVSPYDSPAVRTEKFQKIREAAAAAKQRESQPRAEIPTATSEALRQAYGPTGQAQRVVEGRTPPPAARPAGASGAPGSTRAPGPIRTSGGAGPRPGANAGTQIPTPDALAQYLAAGEAAVRGLEGRGVPGAEELELRKALLAAQEAEREPRMEYKEPSGLSARELFQLASFDPTKGKWVGSLAEKAAGVMGAREAKAEEAKKANREIDVANRRLNTALAQQRLAYASGDRKAKEDADLAVLNARVALREKVIQFGFESRKVGAQEKQAQAALNAAQTRADQRAEGPQITPAQKVQLLKEAAKVIEEAPVIAQLARIADPAMKEQRKQQLIQQRYESLLAQLMGVAPPASAAPAGGQVLRFDAQGNPIR